MYSDLIFLNAIAKSWTTDITFIMFNQEPVECEKTVM